MMNMIDKGVALGFIFLSFFTGLIGGAFGMILVAIRYMEKAAKDEGAKK